MSLKIIKRVAGRLADTQTDRIRAGITRMIMAPQKISEEYLAILLLTGDSDFEQQSQNL